MKVIALALDNKIMQPSSNLARRALFYATYLEEFSFLVPGLGKKVDLSEKVKVFPSGTNNKILSLFYIYKHLAKLLKSGNYQLLIIQDNYFFAVLGVYLASKYKIKVEIQNHGFEKLNWWRRYLVIWSFKRADIIRTVSQRLFKFLQTEFKIDPAKIYIVPVPIERKHLQNMPVLLDLHQKYPGKFIFLTVGRLVPVKNITLQIKALAALHDKESILLIVGDGSERVDLENLVSSLKLEQQVVFLGWQNELADYYRTSDCLLLTSFSEGFPLVPSEAVIYGLPIIMTDVGSAGDLIQDNVNGLIIPINDQVALESAMKKIKVDAVLRLKLKTAQARAVENILEPAEAFNIIHHHWQQLVQLKNK